SNRVRRCSSKSLIRERWTCPRLHRLGSVSAVFEEGRRMNPDDTVRVNRPDVEPDPTATVSTQRRDKEPQAIPEPEAAREEPAAEPLGWSGRLRQIMQRSAQGEARTNIKRQQLREDRTKAFLMLA